MESDMTGMAALWYDSKCRELDLESSLMAMIIRFTLSVSVKWQGPQVPDSTTRNSTRRQTHEI